MYGVPQVPVRQSSLRPIIKPGTPRWIVAVDPTRQIGTLWGAQIAGVLGIMLALVGSIQLSTYSPIGGVVGIAAIIAALVAGWYRVAPNIVMGPGWRYQGVPISGKALSMLEDIDGRFAYAEKMIHEVPTGIEWSEVAPEVQALMWETAGHAARVSALDVEIHEMRYAARGTAQGALKRTLEERRAEHWNMLKDAQLEADALASVAGNAAAAAKVALLRTGSLAALEVVTPTAQGLAARSALRDARARLELLAEVWGQLDESNTVLAEKIDADFERSRAAIAKPKRPRSR